MRVELLSWTDKAGWDTKPQFTEAHLVIYFGGQGLLDSGERYKELQKFYPKAHVMGCSTGGEIRGAEVLDASIVAAAVRFDHTTLQPAAVVIAEAGESFDVGKKLATALNKPGLRYVFLLSDGTNVNG